MVPQREQNFPTRWRTCGHIIHKRMFWKSSDRMECFGKCISSCKVPCPQLGATPECGFKCSESHNVRTTSSLLLFLSRDCFSLLKISILGISDHCYQSRILKAMSLHWFHDLAPNKSLVLYLRIAIAAAPFLESILKRVLYLYLHNCHRRDIWRRHHWSMSRCILLMSTINDRS